MSVMASPTPSPAPQFSALTAYLQSLVSSGQQPGVGFVVVRHGTVIYENAFGNQTTSSDVLIGSASKMPSDLAILSLVDRGLLDLDVPVSNYVPGLFPHGTTITMRELLDHTSGINNCGSNPCVSGSGSDLGGAPCLAMPDDSMESCAQSIVALGSSFSPGTEFDYGGDDYQIAGYVAQVISNEPFTQLFADVVATPCGLTSTTYGAPGSATPTNPRIGGGIYTTIGDYAKMLEVHLSGGICNGHRVVSSQVLSEMQQDYVQGLPVFFSAYPGHDYGMSWWHVTPPTGDQPVVVHDFGVFGAVPWIDNACQTGAFLLIYDSPNGAANGLTIMNYIINNALITGPLGCPTQTASGI